MLIADGGFFNTTRGACMADDRKPGKFNKKGTKSTGDRKNGKMNPLSNKSTPRKAGKLFKNPHRVSRNAAEKGEAGTYKRNFAKSDKDSQDRKPRYEKSGEKPKIAGNRPQDLDKNKTPKSGVMDQKTAPSSPIINSRHGYSRKFEKAGRDQHKHSAPPRDESGRKEHEKKRSPKKAVSLSEMKFNPLNTTNIGIIKEYFTTIAPNLYETLAETNEYSLYQLEARENEIFLIPNSLKKYVKKLAQNVPVTFAGIHLGYMRRKQTKTGFERAFYLSFEGGDFLNRTFLAAHPEFLPQIQRITLRDTGVKTFLYGGEIHFDQIESDTNNLRKKNLIFVFDTKKNYLGLALLIVKQASTVREPDNLEAVDPNSRSKNFALSLLTLTDAGHFLRDGI
jgi:ribosome biogenesis protein Nip4